MASASCRCGKVQLQFTSHSPRISTECCCDSCNLRIQVLQDRGGPSVLQPDKPVVTMKWDDRITVANGRDQLFAYKLTPDTQFINIASSCCHTFLLGRHLQYDTNCVTTVEQAPVWGEQYVPVPPSSRWFVNQWSEERRGKLDKLVGIWVDDKGNLDGEEGFQPVLDKQFQAISAPIKEGATGEAFDEVMKSIGTIQVASEMKSK